MHLAGEWRLRWVRESSARSMFVNHSLINFVYSHLPPAIYYMMECTRAHDINYLLAMNVLNTNISRINWSGTHFESNASTCSFEFRWCSSSYRDSIITKFVNLDAYVVLVSEYSAAVDL